MHSELDVSFGFGSVLKSRAARTINAGAGGGMDRVGVKI